MLSKCQETLALRLKANDVMLRSYVHKTKTNRAAVKCCVEVNKIIARLAFGCP